MQFKEYGAWALLVVLSAGACAKPGAESQEPTPTEAADGADPEEEPAPRRRSEPSVEPRVANLVGLMPLSSTGVDEFLQRHPTWDGRGVLIGILDSGLDLDLPGLDQTTTGEPKVLDVRDFSREGRIELELITVTGDTVYFGGQTLSGFGRVAALASP
ncbi:MAG: S8 family serine peptidase, partial [Gemmatimonadetes bacterium]|nr:S8 family serine peptidase [Gemmatimonadota bacterium]